jgi:hypothetical protein
MSAPVWRIVAMTLSSETSWLPSPRSASEGRTPDPPAPPTRGHQNLRRLPLLQRIDRVVADPDELEARLFQIDLHDGIERAFDPGLQRREPLLVACMRSVSEVARLTWETNAEAGTEKA